MNDIQYATDIAELTLCADDSNAFVSDNSLNIAFDLANSCCNQLSVWFRSNLLSINYSKTVYMLFCPSKKDEELPQNNPNIIIEGINIDRVYFSKFLGIYIDSKLNFKHHINHLINKLNSFRGMVYSRRDFLPFSCRRNLFIAIIYSHIQYCIEVYFSANKTTIDPLHIACNRALRTFQGVTRFHNVKQLYLNYGILPLHLLGKLSVSTLIYKSLHCVDLNLNSISNLFKDLSEPIHDYPTRLKLTNYLYKKSDKSFYSSYINFASSTWNEVPVKIRNSTSLGSFKTVI